MGSKHAVMLTFAQQVKTEMISRQVYPASIVSTIGFTKSEIIKSSIRMTTAIASCESPSLKNKYPTGTVSTETIADHKEFLFNRPTAHKAV